MQTRLIAVLIFVLVVIVAVPLMRVLLKGEPAPPTPLEVLDVGEGRQIIITSQLVMGQRVGLYYQTDEAQEPSFFGTLPVDAPRVRFVVHTSDDGQVAAVAQAQAPRTLLILHDFASGESWPEHERWATVEELDTEGQALLERFEAQRAGEPFTLLKAEGLRPLAIPEGQAATTQPGAAE